MGVQEFGVHVLCFTKGALEAPLVHGLLSSPSDWELPQRPVSACPMDLRDWLGRVAPCCFHTPLVTIGE